MRTLWRIFRASWIHVFRNAWIGAATVFVLTLAMVSVNVLVVVHVMMERVATLLEERVDMTLTFRVNTPEAVVQQARFYLTTLPSVASVTYQSADEVMRAFRARHERDDIGQAFDEVIGNPLGPRLIVKARRTDAYPFLVEAMKHPQYAAFLETTQSETDHQTAIAWVERVNRQVRVAGGLLVALFSAFGLLTAVNAIRVAVYTHREEIAIMRLVGATSAFVRGPFVLSSLWLGFAAMALTTLMISGLLIWVEPALRPLFDGNDPGISSFFQTRALTLLLIEGGALLFLIASVSWIAVGRYIRR